MHKHSNYCNIHVAFVAMVYTHYGKSIKYSCSDYGGEYLSNQYTQFEQFIKFIVLTPLNKMEL